MNLAALISSYREGELLDGAIRSALAAADYVLVLDGPTGDPVPLQPLERAWRASERVALRSGAFESDAAKRSDLLAWAQARKADWAVVIDGDEVLMHPEHLRAQIHRAVAGYESRGEEAIAMPLRIVENDGSVGLTYTRVLRVAAFRRYVNSSNVLELAGGEVVAASNRKLCGPGGFPVEFESIGPPTEEAVARHLAINRGPVGGEPYLWHRPMWRAPERGVERQHEAELRTWAEFQGGALKRP